MICTYDLLKISLEDKRIIEKELKHYKLLSKDKNINSVLHQTIKQKIDYLEKDLQDVNNSIKDLKKDLQIEN